MTNRARVWLAVALKLSVTFGLLAWLLNSVDWSEFLRLIADIPPSSLGAAIFLLMAIIAPVALRWRSIVSALGGGIEFIKALRMNLLAVLINQSVPSNLGGDAYRIMATAQSGMPWRRATLAAIVDKLISLIALAIVALFGVLALLDQAQLQNLRGIAIAGTGLILGSTLSAWVFFRSRGAAKLAGRITILARLVAALDELLNRPLRALLLIALSVAIHCVTIAAMIVVAVNIGLNVPLFPLFGVCAMGLLVARLPISFGGWGVREGVLVLGLAPFGVAPEAALAASITYGLTELIAALTGGVIWIALTMAPNLQTGGKRQAS